jgi:hypothetical protein
MDNRLEHCDIDTVKVDDFHVEPQNEHDLVKIPGGFDFTPMLEKAETLAAHYGVVVAMDGNVLGSGTFVIANGIHGILTAHHVASVPYLRKGNFSLSIRDDVPHRLEVKASHFEHIDLGNSRKNRFEHTGPDLSFLMITDSTLLETLASKKSFYPLIQKTNISQYPSNKLRQLPCFVSGSPQEFSKELGRHKGQPLTKFVHLQVPGLFRSLKNKNGFDYLHLEVGSGVQGYPTDYGGVSGGGIWIPVADETKHGDVDFYPVLQGVVFYQSRPYKQGTRRLLIGHGPNSIYSQLIQKIL